MDYVQMFREWKSEITKGGVWLYTFDPALSGNGGGQLHFWVPPTATYGVLEIYTPADSMILRTRRCIIQAHWRAGWPKPTTLWPLAFPEGEPMRVGQSYPVQALWKNGNESDGIPDAKETAKVLRNLAAPSVTAADLNSESVAWDLFPAIFTKLDLLQMFVEAAHGRLPRKT